MEFLAQGALRVQPAGPSTDSITMQAMYCHSGTRAARQQVQCVIFTHLVCKSAWERVSNKPLQKMQASQVCTSLSSSLKDVSSVLQSEVTVRTIKYKPVGRVSYDVPKAVRYVLSFI